MNGEDRHIYVCIYLRYDTYTFSDMTMSSIIYRASKANELYGINIVSSEISPIYFSELLSHRINPMRKVI